MNTDKQRYGPIISLPPSVFSERPYVDSGDLSIVSSTSRANRVESVNARIRARVSKRVESVSDGVYTHHIEPQRPAARHIPMAM